MDSFVPLDAKDFEPSSPDNVGFVRCVPFVEQNLSCPKVNLFKSITVGHHETMGCSFYSVNQRD
ncbi:hypothetical protein MTBLM1_80237 [Rhodospirillaceae bacterium LM-1]|nr:hypothetical protein MTBLM1_80237 [Rhodospirillaceae bacterium LM-1]